VAAKEEGNEAYKRGEYAEAEAQYVVPCPSECLWRGCLCAFGTSLFASSVAWRVCTGAAGCMALQAKCSAARPMQATHHHHPTAPCPPGPCFACLGSYSRAIALAPNDGTYYANRAAARMMLNNLQVRHTRTHTQTHTRKHTHAIHTRTTHAYTHAYTHAHTPLVLSSWGVGGVRHTHQRCCCREEVGVLALAYAPPGSTVAARAIP
jgi:hypothetical protein